MELSEIINLILGGGFLALLVGIITLKATVKKATAEAEKAKAEAETVRIDNAEHATRILVENIVSPLKKELEETRTELSETRDELKATNREFGATKREMARLRKAVEVANSCKYSNNCPVLERMCERQKGGTSRGAFGDDSDRGQYRTRNPPDADGIYTDVGSGTGDILGQPP